MFALFPVGFVSNIVREDAEMYQSRHRFFLPAIFFFFALLFRGPFLSPLLYRRPAFGSVDT